MNVIVELAADFGKWLEKTAKDKTNAIIIVVLSIFSPLGFVFASSLIANVYRRNKNSRKKR